MVEFTYFALPVDGDHKAKELRLFSVAKPHMRAFHLAWISLFTCFFSTFATAPLSPIIRDNLNLTDEDIGNAGVASLSGAIFSRLAMGAACDLFGPRLSSATVALLTVPVICSISFISSASGFILFRFLVGLSIANFVANQFWMSSMFSSSVVGLANGIAAGWASVGGGLTQFLMPIIYSFICRFNVASFTAWRIAFFVPATLQTVSALAVLAFGQDLPDGDYRRVQTWETNQKQPNVLEVLSHGIKNYRGWILALTYGFCFGVELAIDNIVAEYFYDRFNVNVETAGIIAASFGLANLVSRPSGGVISDLMGRRFGMKGRLWSLWAVQTIGGLLCVLLGRANSLGSSIIVMVAFSVFVQAASGLTFGVVPFVSKRSLGVISGMTGSGGTTGGVITQLLFFSGSRFSKETGISLMGIMIVICTIPVSFIYFPQWGGMLCEPPTEFKAAEEDYYLLRDEDEKLETEASPSV
ncbi:high affinity nitrate transporter 2.5-like [Aristolochia californica]|uniref:high affinity nitrate transporter 2.5-like n=1 Tax=Aristolochia californica TaxID=171875 RepID=UPI0035DD796B